MGGGFVLKGPRRPLGRSKIARASDIPDVAPSQTPVPGVANCRHAVMTNADEVLLVASGFALMVWSSRLRAVVLGRCVPMQCSAAAPRHGGFILEIQPRDSGTPMVRQAVAQGRGT